MSPVDFRMEMVREPHASVLVALVQNAGIEALHCYPTWLGYEIYLGQHWAADMAIHAGERIPGFLGTRRDSRGYYTLTVYCKHPGNDR